MLLEVRVVERSAGEVLVLAVVLLGAVVVLRVALGHASAALARGTRSAASVADRAARALRPGIARRLAATALGLSAPATAVLHPVPAAASPGAHSAPDATTARPPLPAAHAVPAPRAVYVVRTGDTLWDIAHRHLPQPASAAQVARAWPRWYAANRGVIGADPSLIVPGQRLLVPGRRSAGTPTQPHAAPAPTPGTSVPSALSLDPDRR